MMRVLITGGAGYLGRALVRALRAEHPGTEFCVYSRDEAKHVYMQKQDGAAPDTTFILGDVRDADMMDATFYSFRPDTVLHLAALKYVPQSEWNVAEAISVNVDGSALVAKMCRRYGVGRAVAISTDKACKPVSVYGMTKLLMERLWQESARLAPSTHFNLVRYGNVVASTGSVVSIFAEQARQGTLTVTNPHMTRFWLTVDDAVELVMLALEEEDSGTILIPRLRSCTMTDVAVACRAHFVDDPETVEIAVVGTRSGEKSHEDLISEVETIHAQETELFIGSRPVWRVYPPTSEPISEGWPTYSSLKADHLTAKEFREMITVAERYS